MSLIVSESRPMGEAGLARRASSALCLEATIKSIVHGVFQTCLNRTADGLRLASRPERRPASQFLIAAVYQSIDDRSSRDFCVWETLWIIRCTVADEEWRLHSFTPIKNTPLHYHFSPPQHLSHPPSGMYTLFPPNPPFTLVPNLPSSV